MTQSLMCHPVGVTGYRLEQLWAAFERVRDPHDWQAPVLAVIPAAQQGIIEQAIYWFTGTVPIFMTAAGGADRLIVHALGYRLGSGGARPPAREPQAATVRWARGEGVTR